MPALQQLMSAIDLASSEFDYTLSPSGTISLSDGADVLLQVLRTLEARRKQLDKAYTACYFLKLFRDNPLLSYVKIQFDSSQEYNDEGGTFTCYSCGVTEAGLVTDFAKVDPSLTENDMCDTINYQIEDLAGDLSAAFSTHDDEEISVQVTVCRADFEPFLSQPKASGMEMWKFVILD